MKLKSCTIEYLKKINKEPLKHWIWIEIIEPSQYNYDTFSGYYRTTSDYTRGQAFCCGYPGIGYTWYYDDYNIKWVAYIFNPNLESEFNNINND